MRHRICCVYTCSPLLVVCMRSSTEGAGLGIEEASDPVCLGPARIQPLGELLMALQQAQEPVAQRGRLPGASQPLGRNARVEQRIQSLDQRPAQCDRACRNATVPHTSSHYQPSTSPRQQSLPSSRVNLPRFCGTACLAHVPLPVLTICCTADVHAGR